MSSFFGPRMDGKRFFSSATIARVVDGERGLRDVGKALGVGHVEASHVGDGLDEMHAVRRLPHRAFGLRVASVADHHHLVLRAQHAHDLDVDLGYQRTRGVEYLEPAALGIGAHLLRYAVPR